MAVKQQLEEQMKSAMKARDGLRLGCLRMLKSRLMEREVALRATMGRDYEITDEESLSVISTYAKQRRDSIDSYRQGGREDLALKEEAELAVVGEFLPKQLSEDELRGLVLEALAATGAKSAQDIGIVMKVLLPRTRGLADGKLVNQLVREQLEPPRS